MTRTGELRLEIETCRHHAEEGATIARTAADLGVRSTLITEGSVRVFEPRRGGSRSSGSTRAYADGWEAYQKRRQERAAAQQAQRDKASLS